MRILDRVLGWFLVLLGCVHNFVAAPASFAVLDERALWFVAGGLALWYAGFLNLLRAHAPPGGPGRTLAVACLVTNATLLAFVVAYARVIGESVGAEGAVLIASVAVLFGYSAFEAARTLRAPSTGG